MITDVLFRKLLNFLAIHCEIDCQFAHNLLYFFYLRRKKLIDEKATKSLRTRRIQILGLRCCHLFPRFLVKFCLLMLDFVAREEIDQAEIIIVKHLIQGLNNKA